MTMKAIKNTKNTFGSTKSASYINTKASCKTNFNCKRKQNLKKIFKKKLNKNKISIIDNKNNIKDNENNNTKDLKSNNWERCREKVLIFVLPTTSTLTPASIPSETILTPENRLLPGKANYETVQLNLRQRKKRQIYHKHCHSNTPGKYEQIITTENPQRQRQHIPAEGDIATTAVITTEITAGTGPVHEVPTHNPACLPPSFSTPLSTSAWCWSSPLSYSMPWPLSTSLTFWRRNHRLPYSSTSSSNPSPIRGNKLFHGIFMTLLVFSICHSNVLETYAASVTTSTEDIPSTMVEQPIQPSPATITAAGTTTPRIQTTKINNFSEILIKDQPHKPTNMPQQQHLPQSPMSSELLTTPVSQIQQSSTSHQMVEHQMKATSGQPENTDQVLLPSKQKRHQGGHQLPQYLTTTQETSFNSKGITLETTHNHTFQSKSILDGRLTVPMDTIKQLQIQQQHEGQNYNRSKNSVSTGDHEMEGSLPKPMPVFEFGLPQNITARTGHMEAIIKCRVERLGDKSVSWIRKRDLHILSVGKTTYTSDKRFQVTESKDSREWTLHVKSPQTRDSGIYECQVNTEPKMSMAFQLNIMEISPGAKAVIIGTTDLYVKVGSAITLTCLVRQPSIKDIGPIHWYRGGHLLTPFGATNDRTQGHFFVTPAALTSNSDAPDHYSDADTYDNNVDDEEDDVRKIVKNEITDDFRQRVALDQQLCDTIKSKLRISNAQKSDSGNYTCQPTTASSASVMVHVINDENPAAMQKSGTANGRSL